MISLDRILLRGRSPCLPHHFWWELGERKIMKHNGGNWDFWAPRTPVTPISCPPSTVCKYLSPPPFNHQLASSDFFQLGPEGILTRFPKLIVFSIHKPSLLLFYSFLYSVLHMQGFVVLRTATNLSSSGSISRQPSGPGTLSFTRLWSHKHSLA